MVELNDVSLFLAFIIITMKIITGFIYYFLIAVMCLTLSLIVFAFRPFRRFLHKVQSKYRHILQNKVFTAIVYFSFAIIGIILLESVYSFLKIHAHLQSRTLDLIKMIKSSKRRAWSLLIWSLVTTAIQLRAQSSQSNNTESITCPRGISC